MRVAINGLGRIGRATFKILLDTPGVELVAANDLAPARTLSYLLRYDSVYGRYQRKVEARERELLVDGRSCHIYGEKDPRSLPWKQLDVDLVFECTGAFTRRPDLEKHLEAGARKVILSAPAKDEEVVTVVHGTSEVDREVSIVSCASCTTNCITPVIEVLGRRIGVQKATMTTVHAYTSSQAIVDGPSKHLRRGRAGAVNLVPTTTGAAKATAKALPEYEGRFDGAAIRAPVPVGSVADIVALTARSTTAREINSIFREEAGSTRYRGVVGVSDDELVSSDIVGDPRASVIDAAMTQVVGGDLVKIMSWYDNEWGYAAQMVRHAQEAPPPGSR